MNTLWHVGHGRAGSRPTFLGFLLPKDPRPPSVCRFFPIWLHLQPQPSQSCSNHHPVTSGPGGLCSLHACLS